MTERRARADRPAAPRRSGGPADVSGRLAVHRRAVEGVCRGRLRSRVDADAVARQVLDEAAQDPSALPGDALLGAWLVRRAERACRERIRDGARPLAPAVDVRPAAALTPPAQDLIRRTLAVLDARQAQARSLQAALRPDADMPGDQPPSPTARSRHRLLPAVGISGVGLAAALAPVVAVAAVVALVIPAFRPPADPVPSAPPRPPVATTSEGSATAAPISTPGTAAGPTAVGVDQALRALDGPTGTAAPGASAPDRPILTVGGDAGPRVVVDDQDPQDDDLTLGIEELLGIGAGLGDALQELQGIVEDPGALVPGPPGGGTAASE